MVTRSRSMSAIVSRTSNTRCGITTAPRMIDDRKPALHPNTLPVEDVAQEVRPDLSPSGAECLLRNVGARFYELIHDEVPVGNSPDSTTVARNDGSEPISSAPASARDRLSRST